MSSSYPAQGRYHAWKCLSAIVLFGFSISLLSATSTTEWYQPVVVRPQEVLVLAPHPRLGPHPHGVFAPPLSQTLPAGTPLSPIARFVLPSPTWVDVPIELATVAVTIALTVVVRRLLFVRPKRKPGSICIATTSGAVPLPPDGQNEKVLDEETAEVASSVEAPWWRRLWAQFSQWQSIDRAQLMKLGAFVLLSYGCVSNFFMAICFSLSWYVHCCQYPGLFPLAAEQRTKFLIIYAGFYGINNILRPFRVSLSIALAPAFERAVKFLQRTTGLNKRWASGLLIVLVNVVGTTTLLVAGASAATLLAGMRTAAV